MCGFPRPSGSEEFRASSLETLRQMVAAGVGSTLLPVLAAAPPVSSEALIAIRPFVDPAPFRTIGLVYRRGFPRLEMLNVLIDLVQQHVPASVVVIGADDVTL